MLEEHSTSVGAHSRTLLCSLDMHFSRTFPIRKEAILSNIYCTFMSRVFLVPRQKILNYHPSFKVARRK